MKIYGFYFARLLFVICIVVCYVDAKTLFESNAKEYDAPSNADSISSEFRSGDKSNMYRSAINSDHISEEEDESVSSGAAGLKLPKINLQGTQCYDVPSSKRAVDELIETPSTKISMVNRQHKNRRSPYGIVYNQGKPIGILEPISRVYEYQDFQSQHAHDDSEFRAQVKRDLLDSKSELRDDPASIASENGKYASLLTTFKIGNKMKMKQLEDDPQDYQSDKKHSNVKRDLSALPTPAGLVESTVKSKREISSSADGNLDKIENNLKAIMNDLGLINDEKISKREVNEDEDLDSGLNKIGLTKEMHTIERDKKENCPGKTNPNGDSKQQRKVDEASFPADEVSVEGENGGKKARKGKIVDYRSEGESFVRKKRQESKNAENGDIIKGLETSGELTVSGNKSPLASSETENKHKSPKAEKDEKRSEEPSREDQEYEKRLQRNIQNKISEIKAEVKREIGNIKPADIKNKENKRDAKNNNNNKEKKRDEKQSKKSNKARKKRNLMEKETLDISLPNNLERSYKAHVRKRRDATSEIDSDEKISNDNRVTWQEVQEDKTNDINKREESANKNNKVKHNPSSYEFVYRKKREEEKQAETKREVEQPEKRLAKEKSPQLKNEKLDAPSNLVKIVKTPDSHSIVVRNAQPATKVKAKLNDQIAMEGNKLEKLVADSVTLTDSVKSERGAKLEPRVEVELHSGVHSDSPAKREKNGKDEADEISKLTIDDNSKGNKIRIEASSEKDEKKKKRSISSSDREDKSDDESSPHEDKIKNVAKVAHDKVAEIITQESSSKISDDKSNKDIAKDDNVKLVDKLSDEAKPIVAHEDVSKITDDALKSGDDTKLSDDDKFSKNDGKDSQKRSSSSNNHEDDDNYKSKDTKRLASKRDDDDSYKSLSKLEGLAPVVEDKDLTKDSADNVIRLERKSEPSLSLEDMQELDSENTSKRKRRHADYFYYGREKRNDFQPSNNMPFRTYRGDEDEADDESDEFDDDNFDDRTATLIRKRATGQVDNSNYDDFDEDYEPIHGNHETEQRGRLNKRNTKIHNFVADINSDAYSNPNYLYDNGQMRKKRHILEDVVAIHSGGPMLRHLAAAKERNSQPVDATAFRRKRLEKTQKISNKELHMSNNNNNINKDTIAGLSDSDIFGGLPQSYEGELSRFKRVKRGNNNVKST